MPSGPPAALGTRLSDELVYSILVFPTRRPTWALIATRVVRCRARLWQSRAVWVVVARRVRMVASRQAVPDPKEKPARVGELGVADRYGWPEDPDEGSGR